jgi:hypothetical protein
VTTNAFLTGDLVCAGSDGVVAGASGITIDLKGFTLLGDGTDGTRGVQAASGFDKVTFKNGVVRTFDSGVWANANQISVVNVLATGNNDGGIAIFGDFATVKSSTGSATLTSGTGSGIYIAGDGAKVQSSTALATWYGIFVEGAGAKIQSSTASGNEHVGIRVHGDEPEVKGNRAEANGFEHGTTSNYDGTGIWLTGYTTLPTGKNTAGGNDNPNECDPTNLC